jgi:hypothetical protein
LGTFVRIFVCVHVDGSVISLFSRLLVVRVWVGGKYDAADVQHSRFGDARPDDCDDRWTGTESNSTWLDCVYGLIRHIAEMQILQSVLVHVNILKNLRSHEWKQKSESADGMSWLPHFVMQDVDILIEADLLFGSNFAQKFFEQANAKHALTEEVWEMVNAVTSDPPDWRLVSPMPAGSF